MYWNAAELSYYHGYNEITIIRKNENPHFYPKWQVYCMNILKYNGSDFCASEKFVIIDIEDSRQNHLVSLSLL